LLPRTVKSRSTAIRGDIKSSANRKELSIKTLAAAGQQPGPQGLAAVKTYFDANAQASKDLQSLQQPLQNLSGRCTGQHRRHTERGLNPGLLLFAQALIAAPVYQRRRRRLTGFSGFD
jgi:hemophore-related protein